MFRKKLSVVISYTDISASGNQNKLNQYDLERDSDLAKITFPLTPDIEAGKINADDITFLVNGTFQKQAYHNHVIHGLEQFRHFTQHERPLQKKHSPTLAAIMMPGC